MTIDSMPFDFAKDLRKPEIRDRLKLLGYNSDRGDMILTWYEDEYFRDVCARAPLDVRTLLVWPNEESLGGWGMRWAEDVER
ncbi:hypothetical protein [Paractinoplanes toevensis]|uniref:Uncharacterized protein n=1 Tax=Paractinoplanes toevensis TaxID=571911 RepID=A0A919T5T4_9ACTN|nr:hypothetical protein [Actinoplanes toevensis]GIM89708.1 hypothetical protein Ato02nite_015010 [Actinoplanes toevensis]